MVLPMLAGPAAGAYAAAFGQMGGGASSSASSDQTLNYEAPFAVGGSIGEALGLDSMSEFERILKSAYPLIIMLISALVLSRIFGRK